MCFGPDCLVVVWSVPLLASRHESLVGVNLWKKKRERGKLCVCFSVCDLMAHSRVVASVAAIWPEIDPLKCDLELV